LYKTYVTYELTPIAHQHTFYEIHFILDGWVSLNINDQTYKIEKDSFFVLPKNCPHFRIEQSEDFKNFAFMFELSYAFPPPVKKTLEFGYFSELFSSEEIKIFKMSSYDKTLINNIHNNTGNLSIYCVHKIKTEATNLFLEISKYMSKNNKIFEKTATYIPSDDRNILRKYKVELFINANVNKCKATSIKDLANSLGLSPRQTSRFVKEVYGCTFKELWTTTRMLVAKNLIQENKMSLEKIAYSVGYSSYNGFLQAYTKHFGHAPSETEHVEK